MEEILWNLIQLFSLVFTVIRALETSKCAKKWCRFQKRRYLMYVRGVGAEPIVYCRHNRINRILYHRLDMSQTVTALQ